MFLNFDSLRAFGILTASIRKKEGKDLGGPVANEEGCDVRGVFKSVAMLSRGRAKEILINICVFYVNFSLRVTDSLKSSIRSHLRIIACCVLSESNEVCHVPPRGPYSGIWT